MLYFICLESLKDQDVYTANPWAYEARQESTRPTNRPCGATNRLSSEFIPLRFSNFGRVPDYR